MLETQSPQWQDEEEGLPPVDDLRYLLDPRSSTGMGLSNDLGRHSQAPFRIEGWLKP